ncbi:hypothetical protein Rhopal_007658-T1 [Rhodotorula paludigena]|uniref:Spp2/MOS2 G-patch domain-containing protein n=1 Tax=Rhodotorula paludigena TaxID=86838 RepID=A0AAV5GYP2_9BASI|nr:hypothetical protein Rhopal_007658-T1 [Rhodotorula paludigena]
MSGISFKIAAPPRPSSAAASAPPSRPGSSASTSRRGAGASSGTSHRNHRGSPASDDSDDDEGGAGRNGQHDGRERKRPRLGDEEVVEFGRDGAKSKHQSAPTGPLVIPALPNKDWRLAAEELRAGRNGGPLRKKREMYLPEGSATGVMSMSAGQRARDETPVGNVERMNDEEVVGGLDQPAPRRAQREAAAVEAEPAPTTGEDAAEPARTTAAPETEEQRALRELLGGQAGAGAEEKELEAIQSAPDARGGPLDEGAAFKRDLESRPDEASLDDYARVPVGQFGLAMLRGMGWQPGQAASRSGRTGPVEAHVPSSRPALLGIGAKPMAEELGEGSGGKGGKGGKPPRRDKREDMRFVPLMKQAREGSASGSGRNSASPPIDFGTQRLDLFLAPRIALPAAAFPVRPLVPLPVSLTPAFVVPP